jgi:hypothetical protein
MLFHLTAIGLLTGSALLPSATGLAVTISAIVVDMPGEDTAQEVIEEDAVVIAFVAQAHHLKMYCAVFDSALIIIHDIEDGTRPQRRVMRVSLGIAQILTVMMRRCPGMYLPYLEGAGRPSAPCPKKP